MVVAIYFSHVVSVRPHFKISQNNLKFKWKGWPPLVVWGFGRGDHWRHACLAFYSVDKYNFFCDQLLPIVLSEFIARLFSVPLDLKEVRYIEWKKLFFYQWPDIFIPIVFPTILFSHRFNACPLFILISKFLLLI